MGLLHRHPALERAEIIAEMQISGRLHAGKDARLERREAEMSGHGGDPS
jgi:hypothetical protein